MRNSARLFEIYYGHYNNIMNKANLTRKLQRSFNIIFSSYYTSRFDILIITYNNIIL